VEEEKKSSDVEKLVRSQQLLGEILSPKAKTASRPEPMKTESRSSPDQEEIERECFGNGTKKKDKSESRASPGDFLPLKKGASEANQEAVEGDDDQSEEAQAVDDIAMSPISYDREDPVTLMDLPDDILALPISPCGPHDDPALS